MDRNYIIKITGITPTVALRKESVDRNTRRTFAYVSYRPSLSARRAWIEICCLAFSWSVVLVALRKESVDRNFQGCTAWPRTSASLSARRAWIEI